jgi:hypothetical protein
MPRRFLSEEQWKVMSLYIEARERQRNFFSASILALLLVAVGSLLVEQLGTGLLDSRVLLWLERVVPLAALGIFCFGLFFFRVIVVSARASLREAGISDALIAALDKYPRRAWF